MQCTPFPHTLVYPAERLSLGYLISYLRWVMGLFQDLHPAERTLHHLWGRLARLSSRFDQLIARYRAGTLPPPRPYRPRALAALPRRRPSPTPVPTRLPRAFGWLQRGVGWRCTHCRSVLEDKLADAEMQALIAATPAQARRVLRPLCHLLGVTPPPSLALPPRPRRVRAKATPPGAAMIEAAATDPDETDPADRPGLSPEMRMALRRFPRLGRTKVPLMRKRARAPRDSPRHPPPHPPSPPPRQTA